jgi:DNA sulfur modification protein DndE
MTWRTFAGEHEALYRALLLERCNQDGLELSQEVMNEQLRLHVHRGISYLAGDKGMKTIRNLIEKAVPPPAS